MKLVLQETVAGSLILSDNSAFGQSMEIKGPWNAGDIFEIDTRAGQRGVWRDPSGAGGKASATAMCVLPRPGFPDRTRLRPSVTNSGPR